MGTPPRWLLSSHDLRWLCTHAQVVGESRDLAPEIRPAHGLAPATVRFSEFGRALAPVSSPGDSSGSPLKREWSDLTSHSANRSVLPRARLCA